MNIICISIEYTNDTPSTSNYPFPLEEFINEYLLTEEVPIEEQTLSYVYR